MLTEQQSVRVEALTSLGKLYSFAYPEMYVYPASTLFLGTYRFFSENNEPLAIKQFSWIPNAILQMIAISHEVRCDHRPQVLFIQ